MVVAINPYETLGVLPSAEHEVIEAAYRALARKYFPDNKLTGDIRIMQQINEAHDILSDPVKRMQFDGNHHVDPGVVVGNYRLLERIAEGGFGWTYKALHLEAEELVCIKQSSVIDPKWDAILKEEAKSVWNLRHFALPVMRDMFHFPDGSFALVMSYIPGPTLQQVVEKIGPIDAEHVAWITDRILNALSYLHRHGVVHGDLKPQNIIIQPEEHMAVLVDFGCSISNPNESSKIKGTTEYYSAPETFVGLPLVPESDLYSLGMTMIFALTGKLDCVIGKKIPTSTPDPMADFIGKLIRHDVFNRPNWQKADLLTEFEQVRHLSFGRSHSGFKPLVGIS